ncbi:MAG: hypothetical protein KF748_08020 [Xanthobacteraceae bacterium]|nr:hypothetical protein [Xanthobacteraceae bacterium]MCW5676616.1 hypothetical protein [Xanthobacteraceae bacterium]
MKKNGSQKNQSTLLPVILHQATGERPRAALFPAEDAKKAKEIAEKRSLAVIEVSSPELRKVASRLPRGNLSAVGLDIAPTTTLPLYNELIAAHTATLLAQGKLEPRMAAGWDAIKAGDLVIAQHTRADGWYEALVLHRTNDMFHLKWLDYPRDPLFVRHLKAIALTAVPAPGKAA